MKKRSAFEWIVILLLGLLLVAAMAGFGFLLSQISPHLFNPLSSSLLIGTPNMLTDFPPAVTEELKGTQVNPLRVTTLPTSQLPGNQHTLTPTGFVLSSPGTPGVSPFSHFLFRRPLDASQPIWPPAEFRYGAKTTRAAESGIHTGLDLLADYGSPVYALGAGEVIWSGYGIESYLGPDNPYGVAVTIKHDSRLNDQSVYSIYAHLSVTHVESGDRVKQGDQVGEIGLTGNTSGPHLHLEVRLGSDSSFISRNPELFISPLPGDGLLSARLLNTDGSILYDQEVEIESLADNQIWVASSYASGAAIPDDILKENLAITDLPAGQYLIVINYQGAELHHSIFIHPGEITYFTFQGYAGYSDGLPADNLKPLQTAP